MPVSTNRSCISRRRFLTCAGGVASVAVWPHRANAQTADPSPTPTPIRIQTPNLAFADALRAMQRTWSDANGVSDLLLSIVPAEPASDSLLNDARSGARRFSGALVPNWLIPDLVRDSFIVPSGSPPVPLPAPLAQLRSFGGDWIATDLDRDCDLLFFRQDLLANRSLSPAETWEQLIDDAAVLASDGTGGMALPITHAQQAADHFCSVAGSMVLAASAPASFWFAPDTMEPGVGSDAHVQALSVYGQLAQSMPEELRSGSTGDLWQAFLDGVVAYLIASSDFVPYALERGLDPGVLGISQLPGVPDRGGELVRVGNVTGASWGGVIMSAAGERPQAEVSAFLRSLSAPEAQTTLWTDQGTGITPAPVSEADAAVMRDHLIEAGWPDQVAAAWTAALSATFTNPVHLPALRIGEARRYVQALEDRIVPFLVDGQGTAADALGAAVEDWTQINEAIGVETQRDLYARSLMPAPAGDTST